MSVVIGISAHYHTSACCLLRDGLLVASAEEERFTRLKYDASVPRHAFKYCLKAAGCTIADVDCVAYYEDPYAKIERQLFASLAMGWKPTSGRIELSHVLKDIRNVLGWCGRTEYVPHHLSHAASAYFYSAFSEASVLTVDAVGEWDTLTYGHGSAGSLELIQAVEFPHSLGLLYSAITAYLGFGVNDGEYKVMGLAPYGRPTLVDKLRELISVGNDGTLSLRLKYFELAATSRLFSAELTRLLGHAPRGNTQPLEPFHADVAASVQALLEEVLLTLTRYLHALVGTKNLCMAGGVALNCVANRRVRCEGPFENMFVQPVAGDAGACLGAAAVAAQRLEQSSCRPMPLEHLFLGPEFSDEEISRFLSSTGIPFRVLSEAELYDCVAQHLDRGEVIAWFQGRMEFGPRALGARSILADPRRNDIQARVNRHIKNREDFRPFAPAVLEHRRRDYFALDHPAPFMIETCEVSSSANLPGVTHVDGSARVQTVTEATSRRFAKLLEAFERRTGCAVLLNTSFNGRDEPIVQNLSDALLCFAHGCMDMLVLGNCVVRREAVPAALCWANDGGPVATPEWYVRGTYTF